MRKEETTENLLRKGGRIVGWVDSFGGGCKIIKLWVKTHIGLLFREAGDWFFRFLVLPDVWEKRKESFAGGGESLWGGKKEVGFGSDPQCIQSSIDSTMKKL